MRFRRAAWWGGIVSMVMAALACGESGWPETSGDYEFVSPTYLDDILAPRRDGFHYDCCRDFGEKSRDFVEEGTHGVDNAVAGLFDSLAIFLGLNFQGQLDENVESGTLVLVLDHANYKKQGRPFTLVAHQARFAPGTTWETARQGGGLFEVKESSFVEGTGTPRGQFPEAVVDAEGVLEAKNGSALWALSIQGVPFDARMSDLRLEARRHGDDGGVRYSEGTLSGYITLDDFYAGLNDKIDEACDCLQLSEPVYTKNSGGDWEGQCVPEAPTLCSRPEEVNCHYLAAGGSGGPWLCEIIPGVLEDSADIDLDGDPATRYEAASVGLRWSSVPAVID